MALIVLAFLVWLFANGKFSDWAALAGVKPPNTGGYTGSW